MTNIVIPEFSSGLPVIQRKRKNRTKEGWRSSTRKRLALVKGVVERMRGHWPLTLRQIYYQLVGSGDFENKKNVYKNLGTLLTKARLQGLVEWDAIEDRGRDHLPSAGWQGLSHFIADQLEDFLSGYRRDPLIGQALALEVWVEKDAVSRVVHDAAFPYGVPVYVDKGYNSVTLHREATRRILNRVEAGQSTKILYFGDLDPSGWDMPDSIEHTLREEMDVSEGFEIDRCALLPDQVRRYRLPVSPDAIKERDTRAKAYRKHFGKLAVELDALPPQTLQEIVSQKIEENLDQVRFAGERGIGQSESEWMEAALPAVRDAVHTALDKIGGRP